MRAAECGQRPMTRSMAVSADLSVRPISDRSKIRTRIAAQETQTTSGLPKKSLEERGWIWQLDLAIFKVLELFIYRRAVAGLD